MRISDAGNTKQLSKWLATVGLAKAVDVRRVEKSDLFDVNVTLQDGETLPIADLGYGLSQALPVLAQCTFSSIGSTLLFEQPELHLHNTAARQLAHVFREVVLTKHSFVIAETHSRELFYEIMQLVNNGTLEPTDVVAFDVERREGASRFSEVVLENVDGGYEANHPWGKAL